MEHHVQCDGCHCYAIDNTAALKPANPAIVGVFVVSLHTVREWDKMTGMR